MRGERRDTDDDLYRIAPNKLTMSLTYQPSDWIVAVEAEGVRAQSRVSATNSEQETSSYGLLNVMGSWQVKEAL